LRFLALPILVSSWTSTAKSFSTIHVYTATYGGTL
jgi:hypothetical protein